ncbi:MAG TPA: exo-alpha-sialidase [Firmicutes bacterium]|jgi:sialidase-1|nr:exo-alpha-sialidase [Bacillota bacterium]
MLKQQNLFVSGDGGYHTYRIPAIVVSTRGTLLAFCEGRRNGAADDGDIDLLLRRSYDGGETWRETQLVYDDGDNTVGNPAPVVDHTTGTIFLLFCINNRTVWVTSSEDDGATWSTPEEITHSVKRPWWTWYATGPCHGIQLSTGRLLIPCDHTGHAHVIYSDDHGKSWQLGGIVPSGTNESVAVETVDGNVYMNCRNTRDTGRAERIYSWSTDGGESFSPIAWDASLPEPICQASMIRFSTEQSHGKNRILFSNPAHTKRERMTVRLSYDECRTWNAGKILYEGPTAYSDMAVLPDMTICCLYECGDISPYQNITLARFDLAWLTDGQDQL